VANRSRRKGAGGEREWAKVCGGRKISRTGYDGPDVEGRDLELYEVKRPGSGVTKLHAAIEQGQEEGAPLVAIRQDGAPWVVAMSAEVWFEIREILPDGFLTDL
jgi:hypothetical protein